MDTELYSLRAKRSGVDKAYSRLEEIEELLSEGTKAAGLFEGYANRERNTIRNLKRYADKVAARLDTLIDAAKKREALNNK